MDPHLPLPNRETYIDIYIYVILGSRLAADEISTNTLISRVYGRYGASMQ